jgi:hypothetical protein
LEITVFWAGRLNGENKKCLVLNSCHGKGCGGTGRVKLKAIIRE